MHWPHCQVRNPPVVFPNKTKTRGKLTTRMDPSFQPIRAVKAEDILGQGTKSTTPLSRSTECLKHGDQPDEAAVNLLSNIPRGRPRSGRLWKSQRKSRHSEMTLDKPLKTSWKRKMKERAEKKSVKAFELELKEAKAKEQEDKRKRIEARRKLKEEMRQRAEIVQPIKNPAKIKRMKKKQLRAIQKK